jgi:hypothetical protein
MFSIFHVTVEGHPKKGGATRALDAIPNPQQTLDHYTRAGQNRNLLRAAYFYTAVFGRTQKKDSFAAPKTLPFNDFSHFAPCA